MHSHKEYNTYKGLSHIYDDLMHDIDYDDWADFIDEIIQKHHPEGVTLLELACGTGNHAISLDELETYEITASDISREMLDIAEAKAYNIPTIKWVQLDALTFKLDETFDIVIMLFDSMNYMMQGSEIQKVISNVKKHLNSGGIFVFDFTTPINSVNGAESMNDEGTTPDDYRYVRKSFYLPSEKIHTNEFDIEKLSTDKKSVVQRFREVHRQRIYTIKEMQDIVAGSEMNWISAYGAYELKPANDKSHRVTVVLQ